MCTMVGEFSSSISQRRVDFLNTNSFLWNYRLGPVRTKKTLNARAKNKKQIDLQNLRQQEKVKMAARHLRHWEEFDSVGRGLKSFPKTLKERKMHSFQVLLHFCDFISPISPLTVSIQVSLSSDLQSLLFSILCPHTIPLFSDVSSLLPSVHPNPTIFPRPR